ncbi:AraC-like protein [Acinetobacter calcoaceticus]|uniref:AraC-like protein n=1 Tax=Acinetobacter calcoaceticus TaxID=471 RepID=A0A4R1Y4P1_ACICA|nr:AraC-like protein [Acinetobacter calcoaceticus]
MKQSALIPNIQLSEVYDQKYIKADLHYEAFAKLARFYDFNMPIHTHQGYYQIHYLSRGQLRFILDGIEYQSAAPVCFFSPPNTVHGFKAEHDCEGHVLTIAQDLLTDLLACTHDSALLIPRCIQQQHLSGINQDLLLYIAQLFIQMQNVHKNNHRPLRETRLKCLSSLIISHIITLAR